MNWRRYVKKLTRSSKSEFLVPTYQSQTRFSCQSNMLRKQRLRRPFEERWSFHVEASWVQELRVASGELAVTKWGGRRKVGTIGFSHPCTGTDDCSGAVHFALLRSKHPWHTQLSAWNRVKRITFSAFSLDQKTHKLKIMWNLPFNQLKLCWIYLDHWILLPPTRGKPFRSSKVQMHSSTLWMHYTTGTRQKLQNRTNIPIELVQLSPRSDPHKHWEEMEWIYSYLSALNLRLLSTTKFHPYGKSKRRQILNRGRRPLSTMLNW